MPRINAPEPNAHGSHCCTRNAVVAFLLGYNKDAVNRLLVSAQAVLSNCDDVILFGEDRMPEGVVTMERGNVIWVDVLRMQEHVPERLRGRWRDTSAQILRFLLLGPWLGTSWQMYEYVLFIDGRDTLFQSNPFEAMRLLAIDGLMTPREAYLLELEPDFNQRAIRECGGERALTWILQRPYGNKNEKSPVLCVGMFGGTALAMLDYAEALRRVFLHNSGCNDQATHMYLFYRALAGAAFPHSIAVVDHRVGPFTHAIIRGIMERDRKGRVVNCFGEPYAVLHQFDRGHVWDRLSRVPSADAFDGHLYVRECDLRRSTQTDDMYTVQ